MMMPLASLPVLHYVSPPPILRGKKKNGLKPDANVGVTPHVQFFSHDVINKDEAKDDDLDNDEFLVPSEEEEEEEDGPPKTCKHRSPPKSDENSHTRSFTSAHRRTTRSGKSATTSNQGTGTKQNRKKRTPPQIDDTQGSAKKKKESSGGSAHRRMTRSGKSATTSNQGTGTKQNRKNRPPPQIDDTQGSAKKKKKSSGGSGPRRLVSSHPATQAQVKCETSERVLYSALNRFVKAQSILTPSSEKYRKKFEKVQAIAIVIDEMVQEPNLVQDDIYSREIPQVNFIAPNNMTQDNLGRLLVRYGNALQGLNADVGFEVFFTNSGKKQSATEVLDNLYGADANLEQKYGPKSKKKPKAGTPAAKKVSKIQNLKKRPSPKAKAKSPAKKKVAVAKKKTLEVESEELTDWDEDSWSELDSSDAEMAHPSAPAPVAKRATRVRAKKATTYNYEEDDDDSFIDDSSID